MISNLKILLKYLFVAIFFNLYIFAYASTTDGTISSINYKALLCLNTSCSLNSRINFLTTNGTPIHITNNKITGNAWSEDMGWIIFNPTNAGVNITNGGDISGYAWGENAGWINFSPRLGGVYIDDGGRFNGYAWAQNYGWIKFNCSVLNACVETDWRPINENGNSGSVIAPPELTEETISNEEISNEIEQGSSGEGQTLPTVNESSNNNTSSGSGYVQPENILNETTTSSEEVINSTLIEQLKFGIDNQTIVNMTKNLKNKTLEILETPTGDITSKILTTTGAVSGLSVGVGTALFASPISLYEILLIPMRLLSFFAGALGIKRKKIPWGVVYDSVTKQPIDPAYVTLKDLNGHNVATSITDIDGRYGFLVPAGKYKMTVNKTNYLFPSQKLFGRESDELYPELYFNEIIDVPMDGIINKNIPMDPLKFDWNEFVKKDQSLMKFFSKRNLYVHRISNWLFIIGFIVSVVSIIASPGFYSIAIFLVYSIILILKKTVLRIKDFGSITIKETKTPLPFAILRIFFADSGYELTHKITDSIGRYYCIIPNGTYRIKIEKKNPDETYDLVYTSEPIEIRNGHLDKNFEV